MSDGYIEIPKDRWLRMKWWQAILPRLFGLPITTDGKRLGALYRGIVYIGSDP